MIEKLIILFLFGILLPFSIGRLIDKLFNENNSFIVRWFDGLMVLILIWITYMLICGPTSSILFIYQK